MKNNAIKTFLYKIKVIPLYSSFLQYRYDAKQKRLQKTDRWYFRFLPIKKNKVVFDNFLGKGYGDNPKAIAEEIIRQHLDWDLVWLTRCHQDMPSQIRQVEYGSPEAMREMATAKMWIFNVRNVKHPEKRKGQVYLQTWHGGGIPFKKIEAMTDNLPASYVETARKDGQICDYILSSSSMTSKIWHDYFWLNEKTVILDYGEPRLDILFSQKIQQNMNKQIRAQYHISENTGIVLYMPTFRDDFSMDFLDMDFSYILNVFEEKFNKKFVLLLRLHPNMSSVPVTTHDERIINVTSYPNAIELFLVSDFGISDYSNTIILQMPLLRKPTFIYANDFEIYKRDRGLTELYEQVPVQRASTNAQLADVIRNFDETLYFDAWEKFLKVDRSFNDGNASRRVVDFISTIFNGK